MKEDLYSIDITKINADNFNFDFSKSKNNLYF